MRLTIIILCLLATIACINAQSINETDTDAETDSIIFSLNIDLTEVVVTAKELTGLTSVSRIDRDAMRHLQPTSFADILELLPGNISKDPDMGSANSISLRETGTLNATGSASKNDDYDISSLGTLFVVDGAPINTDANMQSIGGIATDSNSPLYKRDITNRGVDMRTISTDNIESVEIVRGIPSSEYGNLTSGMVNIKRIRRATPFTARFKADEFSKLFSAGKGFAVHGGAHIINVDAGYLDSKVDPRDPMENYKRVTASVRANMRFDTNSVTARWNYGIDYSGSFDKAKVDPDLNYNKVDKFSNDYNRWGFSSELNMDLHSSVVISDIVWNMAASYERDLLRHIKQVSPARAAVAPTSMEECVHDGEYLLSEYLADYRCEGKPVTLFGKLKATGSAMVGATSHSYMGGMEWSMSKNYGHGQIYDLRRPLSAGWSTRPRDYSEIPASHTASFYLEDRIIIVVAEGSVELQPGVRATSLLSLDRRYAMAGKFYLDPRINLLWTLTPFNVGSRSATLTIGAGYGMTTRMPTADYLYPQSEYSDFTQLNYYNTVNPKELSKVSLRTYINDAANFDLRPARNIKYEMRTNLSVGTTRLSVTWFHERLNSGFRYSTIYLPYTYNKYDASAIDGATLTAPPDVGTLPFAVTTVLDGYRRVTNGSSIRKQGIEFQLTTPRLKPLATSLIVNGAWLRSTYSNSQMLYKTVSDVVGDVAVKDRYVGLYDSNDGRVNSQFNTNFMFDTQIPRWGLLLTTSVQCMWRVSTTRLRENGVPESYLSAETGELHPYDSNAVQTDPMLQYLVKYYSDELYKPYTVPTAVYVNLKATKQIGPKLRISAFVNRIVDYLPDYTRNGLVVRRSASPYFGMEINLSL
ncbi:MAG: TonB-dependent receptor plug domain-containing protein [Muribaculaceae bacterium]|nr:TonB-dependent receptor plug domain-containing protein [Muribaculaceae bacterium]